MSGVVGIPCVVANWFKRVINWERWRHVLLTHMLEMVVPKLLNWLAAEAGTRCDARECANSALQTSNFVEERGLDFVLDT